MEKVHLIVIDNGFAALEKPAGLHTVILAKKENDSLEKQLPDLLPNQNACLLNRLDQGTSGVVLVALNTQKAEKWKNYENAGLVKKYYLALVAGEPPDHCLIKYALDTRHRRKTKILKTEAEPLRYTEIFTRVRHISSLSNLTLIECLIHKGARHQIRAHLAAIGFPLYGDPLYNPFYKTGSFYLHHTLCTFPSFTASSLPQWLPKNIVSLLHQKASGCL